MGVASVKIEGRMKRPEYVAVVTKAYRAAIDGRRVTENDMQQLEAVFSRQGFLHRAITREKSDRSMFGTRQEPEDNRELFSAARATYESGESPRVPVKFYAMVRAGEPAQLAAQDEDGHVCKAVGPVPEQALVHSLTADDLESKAQENGRHAVLLRDGALGGGPGLMLPGVGNQRDAARGARRADRAARQSGASKDERLQSACAL